MNDPQAAGFDEKTVALEAHGIILLKGGLKTVQVSRRKWSNPRAARHDRLAGAQRNESKAKWKQLVENVASPSICRRAGIPAPGTWTDRSLFLRSSQKPCISMKNPAM